jgi:NhaP-type Na+/H+ or K+/H+ antiporter
LVADNPRSPPPLPTLQDDFGRIGVGWLFLAAFIVLPFRRIPYTVLFHTLGWLPDTHDKTEAAFLGWFGPVGGWVGACRYVRVCEAL